MKKTKLLHRTLFYAVALALSAVFVLPYAWMVRSALMDQAQIFVLPPEWIPRPFRFENFAEALTLFPFSAYLLNTLTILCISMVGLLATSTLAAFGFSRVSWKGRDWLFGLILTSMMLPGFVTLIPTFIGWRTLGFYDTFVPLIAPAFFGGGAFNIFLLRQFYKTIPLELDEAAYVDGAGYFRIYWQIILPLSRSPIIVVALFAFMYYWNDFFDPLIYLEDEEKFTLSLGLQQFLGMYNAQWHLLMAASTAVITPALALFVIGQKYFVKGIALTGLKG